MKKFFKKYYEYERDKIWVVYGKRDIECENVLRILNENTEAVF